ncbi:MAG: AAA family ATPase [Melioribacteraceae bacterium]|nr:AAA family ATPase [Melioribacteraceae bacterium]
MIKLISATVNKYKSFSKAQTVSFQKNITTLVGMNESGKTAFLEALAKVNYFNDDPKFKFDVTQDYPRKELKAYQKDGTVAEVMSCKYEISNQLLEKIKSDLGENVFRQTSFQVGVKYNYSRTWSNIQASEAEYLKCSFENYSLDKEIKEKFEGIKSLKEIPELLKTIEDESAKKVLEEIQNKIIKNSHDWPNRVEGYIVKNWLEPNLPKFWYYDEYYSLPSRINLSKFDSKSKEESIQTINALFEMAEINIKEILEKSDFERFKAELESTSIHITEQIFKYWSANVNLDIKFDIDAVERMENGQRIVDKYLDLRIFNNRYKMSLPLAKRSKGFNWFFSFIVWFGKIQSDKHSNYILLLDEPGLNLHASAQADLLRFIEDLSKDYQIIYSTHSPFMIESNHLEQVRTVFESDEGSIISETIQEKDPRTLFPLQAALGYDIAQNLFVSKNNLIVEGPADLIYLSSLSSILEDNGKVGLKEGITIVPVGGLDKVATFISLLAGSKLNIACLLDNFTDVKGKQRVDDLIKYKIIKEKNIRFFGEFANTKCKQADIEDLFSKGEYLQLFNSAFNEYAEINESDLDVSIERVVEQISKIIGHKFNHYRPAYFLANKGIDKSFFTAETIERFEKLFIEINRLF